MMKKQNKKRGFTILELTIVVSVIAILSAVLIPVFSGVIKNANLSADKAAVRSLNTIIAESDEEFDTPEAVIAYLDEKGYDLSSYVPASKDYSFVWSADKDMIMIYSETEKAIVFPAAYAGKAVEYVTLVTDEKEVAVATNDVATLENGGLYAITNEFTLTATQAYVYVQGDLVVDLTGKISSPDYTKNRGVFTVASGASLTINGNGTVDGKSNFDSNIAVWAYGGDVVINGGTYTNEGARAFEDDGITKNNNELIYATAGGKITINGGTFKCARPEYTLNCRDGAGCSIIVKGGKFWNYNPKTMATDASIIIPEGYDVKDLGDGWFEVVKA